jgi:hypothetical protein
MISSDNPNHNSHPSKSPVTVMRKQETNSTTEFIVNETVLSSTDPSQFNVHDYAIFVQPAILPHFWFTQLKQRLVKANHVSSSSSVLWAKVRAVTYMTTLAHRTGSWYSDDRTEKSPDDNDDISSMSDHDEQQTTSMVNLVSSQAFDETDPPMGIRRSLSSIDYVKHDENYSSSISRSHSATQINTTDLPANSHSISLSSSTATSSQATTTSRVYRFLHCIIL